MDGKVAGWLEGRVAVVAMEGKGGWKERWLDGWMEGWLEGGMAGWLDGKDGWMAQ